MSVTYKDIDQLTQKSTVAGSEKIPVSDTEFITPNQISGLSGLDVGDSGVDFAISDEDGNHIAEFYEGQVRTKYFDSKTAEITSNKVTSLSSSSTDTQYPSAKCVYDLVGDIETLLAAL